jgi:hypothetical protein
MTSRRTVIRPELSAWTCQPFCCQRTCTLIPSGRPSIPLGHCPESVPDNKKPGVERRAKPPSEWLCAKLDSFLSSARKEPHYRVYFRPSLDLTLGRRFFDPTVMPCRLRYPRAICEYTRFHGFVKPVPKLFCPLCGLLCKTTISNRTKSLPVNFISGRDHRSIDRQDG